jgi:VWFA-related protein
MNWQKWWIAGCVLLLPVMASAQSIGQQGTDPFTGQPAQPAPTVRPLDTTDTAHGVNESKLVFRSGTVLVQVPAVVTDGSGNHVHGLNKDDFRILENGKGQKITVFEEVTASSARPAPTPAPPGTFSNVTFDFQKPLAITVIALDLINTPFLDQEIGRKQLIKFLGETMDSGHAFGLVVIGGKGVKVLAGLNSDPAALIAALKKASGEISPMETFGTDGKTVAFVEGQTSQLTGGISPGEDPASRMRRFIVNADAVQGKYQQDRAIEDTMKAFLSIALSLSGIPGRKSLIWATGSFPFMLDSPSSVPGGNLALLYERAMRALNDAQVAVYPVDLRGVMESPVIADATYSGGMSGPEIAGNAVARGWVQNSSTGSLKNFAEMTGGSAFFNNNDLSAGFNRAADDASSYYLLGYSLGSNDTKPGWRKLQVQVKCKDCTVRARNGVLFTNATVDPQLTHQADIDFALNSPFDSTGIPVTMQWQPPDPNGGKNGDKRKIVFALRLPATSVIEETDQNRFDVDFIAQATKQGAPAGHAGQTIKGAVPASALDKIKAEGIFYRNSLDLPPGEYDVRFVVRDNLTGKIGSVSAPLKVD